MNKMIVVAGPTAVGKSELSIELAKRLNLEIISADSIQVYKGLDIGSAKLSPAKMQGVKHYLIDVLPPQSDFNVYIFKEMAGAATSEIYSKGKTPLIVGGTGFYIQSVVYDIDYESEDNSAIRLELEELLRSKGSEYLRDMLRECDIDSYNTIHPNNTKRIIRAIEYYKLNNKPISMHNRMSRSKASPYDLRYIVLTDDRSAMYERINKRVDSMIEAGLVDEVRGLVEQGLDESYNSMQGIGYREILMYLRGECTLDEAIEAIKANTRHFAKRQLTWFRREKDANWIDISTYNYDKERILSAMTEIIDNG